MDPFSTDCFIDDDLFSNCNVPMQKTELSLTTMQETKGKVQCNKVYDIEIESLDGRTKTVLHHAYARSSWPFELSDSPTFSDICGYH